MRSLSLRCNGILTSSCSAIVKPAHDEVLDLSSGDEAEMYTLRGYAYSGGGRRINRVEITLDGGKTWTLAEM